jgi:hypothetical protein
MHADWIDLLRLFAERRVRYLIVGGMAVAIYGFEVEDGYSAGMAAAAGVTGAAPTALSKRS